MSDVNEQEVKLHDAKTDTGLTVAQGAREIEALLSQEPREEPTPEPPVSTEPDEEIPAPTAHPMRPQIQNAYSQWTRDAAAFEAETQKINWQELRQNDPAEYAIRADELNQRRAQLQRQYQEIAKAHEQVSAHEQGSVSEHIQKLQAREQKKLLSKIPGWNNPEVAQREKAELGLRP